MTPTNIHKLMNEIIVGCKLNPEKDYAQILSEKHAYLRLMFSQTAEDILDNKDWPALEHTFYFSTTNFEGWYDKYGTRLPNNANELTPPNNAVLTKFNVPDSNPVFTRWVKEGEVFYNRDSYYPGRNITSQAMRALREDVGYTYPQGWGYNPADRTIYTPYAVQFTQEGKSVDTVQISYITDSIFKKIDRNDIQTTGEFPPDDKWEVITENFAKLLKAGTIAKYLGTKGGPEDQLTINYWNTKFNLKQDIYHKQEKPGGVIRPGVKAISDSIYDNPWLSTPPNTATRVISNDGVY